MKPTQPQASELQAGETQAKDRLEHAAQGLLFPSEIDAPLVPFFWPGDTPDELTSDGLIQLAQIPLGRAVKAVKLDTLFGPATKEEEWHNDEEKVEIEKFKNLVKVIKDVLDDVKVFRVGETKVDVYIVGKAEGGYAGLQTQVVET